MTYGEELELLHKESKRLQTFIRDCVTELSKRSGLLCFRYVPNVNGFSIYAYLKGDDIRYCAKYSIRSGVVSLVDSGMYEGSPCLDDMREELQAFGGWS